MAIRIFVGCSANNEDLEAMAVLHYTLEQYASEPLDIVWMQLSRDPTSFWYSNPDNGGWCTTGWATPFSALRWGIPSYCGYDGRAIYLDADMIVRDDIAKLWNQEFRPLKAIMSKGDGITFCSMLMDCHALKEHLPPISRIRQAGAYREIGGIVRKRNLVQPFSGNWNCRDSDKPPNFFAPDVKIIHYTAIPTQPTHKHARKRLAAEGKPFWYAGESRPHSRKELVELFDRLLIEANAAGYTLNRYRVQEEFGDYRRQRRAA